MYNSEADEELERLHALLSILRDEEDLRLHPLGYLRAHVTKESLQIKY